MKRADLHAVVAYIQPFQIEAVVHALRRLPSFPGVSVSEVRGFGRHLAHSPHEGERTEVDPFEPRLRLEIVCPRTAIDAITQAIQEKAHTGNQGDGKIFVLPVSQAVRIRTRETGAGALL